MVNMMGPKFLAAPGAERPDYTAFNFPDASLTDTNTEEIELDQALSLAGRMGRDFLGAQISGLLIEGPQEHLTMAGADIQQAFNFRLNTRTGGFSLNDPELLWQMDYDESIAFYQASGVGEQLVPHNPQLGWIEYGEPELYVAPRLFWRLTNDGDQTIAVSDFAVRIASVSRRLSFRLFVELLERFADVTLL